MKRQFYLSIILLTLVSGCAVFAPLERSRLIAIFHLIENGDYEEAKDVIEHMKNDENAGQWPRTWYARGLLCQTAYQEGIKNNDKKKYELYNDQLYVAFSSYERARILDKRGRLDRQLASKYVLLSNDFQKLGEKHFNNREYDEALRAFEQAIRISRSPILPIQADSDLKFNTALAAYESKEWEKAIEYFTKLNEINYSTNVLHLLSSTYLEKGDTVSAKRVLTEGINKYKDSEEPVMLLVDLLYTKDSIDRAIKILTDKIKEDPSVFIYLYTKGLIYQKTEQYQKAIDAYEKAVKLKPDELLTHVQIATCYYNIGIEIEENARTINNSLQVREEKARSESAFNSAVSWLDKVYNEKPEDQAVIKKVYQLYGTLNKTDKVRSMQSWIN